MASIEIEIIGWLGAFILLYAYFLLNEKKVTSKNLGFQLMNLIGGGMLALNAYFNGALPSTFMNVVWVLIAVVGMEQIFKRRNPKK